MKRLIGYMNVLTGEFRPVNLARKDRTETTMIAEPQERKVGHAVIAKFFEPKVRDMGGGLRIIELPSYITVDERDLIVKAVQAYISRSV